MAKRIAFQVALYGQKELAAWAKSREKALQAALLKNVRDAAKVTRRMVKAEFGKGKTLGSISGETKRSVNMRVFRNRGWNPVAVVGPVKRKGNLLGIHERGMSITRSRKGGRPYTAKYPVRAPVAAGTKKAESEVFKLIGRTFRVLE